MRRELTRALSEPMTGVEVLHVDDAVAVVAKASGLSTHRGWDRTPPFAMTLTRDAIGHWVYPVHRLDRGTSGALVFALTSEHARTLAQRFEAGEVEKRYLALVWGEPPESFVIDEPMKNRKDGPEVEAVTEVRRLFVTEHGLSLVEVRPRTGRRHQIRRHLRRHHHTLAGDVEYGRGPKNRILRERFGLHRLALHAVSLAFEHPVTKRTMTFHARLPDDLAAPLHRLGIPNGRFQPEAAADS